MKYLKKVIIKNFQSHKDSIIEFDPGLNVIVGPSDSGKSAIIRSIKWALYNEPAGDYFIREGEKEASVILEFSNNIKIKRLRSKSKNAYIICNDDEEIVFEGFGNKVPQEIVDLIGIEKIPLDTNESNAINLGEQLEGAFLLSERSSTRASAIGRLVGVNLIDDALKDTLKDLRNISIEKKTISKNITNIQAELITFDYLDNLKESILKLEDVSDSIRKKTRIKNKFIKALNSYNIINKDKENINYITDNLTNIDFLEKSIVILENKAKDLTLYKNLNNRLHENKKQLSYNKIIVDQLINNKLIEKSIREISVITIKLGNLKKFNDKLFYYKKEIKQSFIYINDLKYISFIDSEIKCTDANILRLKKIKKINNNLVSLYNSINIGEEYLRKLENLDKTASLLKKIDKLTDKTDLVIKNSINYKKNKNEINEQNTIIYNSKKIIDNNLKEYEILLKKNATCPFCLSIINDDKIEHIIKHYS